MVIKTKHNDLLRIAPQSYIISSNIPNFPCFWWRCSPEAYAIPIQVRQKSVKSVFISRSPVQNVPSLVGFSLFFLLLMQLESV